MKFRLSPAQGYRFWIDARGVGPIPVLVTKVVSGVFSSRARSCRSSAVRRARQTPEKLVELFNQVANPVVAGTIHQVSSRAAAG
jgi:hypothetical protein